MRHPPPLSGDRSGTSALEFALVMPLFVLLMLCIVDLGRYVLTMISLDTLVSATARALIINCGNTGANYGKLTKDCAGPIYGLTTEQKRDAAPFLYVAGQAPAVSISCGAGACPATGQITVTASLPSLTFFFPWDKVVGTGTKDALGNALTRTATLYY